MAHSDETSDWYSDAAATFGDRVAAAREAIGLSEDGLAKRLGIKAETVRKWENDLSEPRANKLQMLSGVLNVSMRWLLTGEGEEIVTEDFPADREISGVLADVRSLRSEMLRNAERLGVLEKRLRQLTKAPVL